MAPHDRSQECLGEGESSRSQCPPPHPQSMEGGSPHSQYQQPPTGNDRSRQPQASQPPVLFRPTRVPNRGYDYQPGYPGPPLPAGNGYAPPHPPDSNGYPAPPQNGHAPLRPLKPPPPMESRSNYPSHTDHRRVDPQGDYYEQGRPPCDRHAYYEADYRGPPPYGWDSRDGDLYQNGPPLPPETPAAQAAPSQRTSIACKYCRKRKIRCSGYQNAPDGRCGSCTRTNQECIFQPISSGNTATFVHVSAVSGSLPPGTPLYGAYGQPLAGGPATSSQQPPEGPPPPAVAPLQAAQYLSPHIQRWPMHRSPTDGEMSSSGRRKKRESEEGHERRLPPPNGSEEEPCRRFPVSSNNGPRSQYYSYQLPMPAPHTATQTPPVSSDAPTPPQRSPSNSTSSISVTNGNLDPRARSGGSTNGTTPAPQPTVPPPSLPRKNPMRVTSIVDTTG